MKWIKKGRIYLPRKEYKWSNSHAQMPVIDKCCDDRLRIYFGTRDISNRTVISYIEVDSKNPAKVLYEHDSPVLGLGKLGMFDDSGVMPSDIVNYQGKKYLYYMGLNKGGDISYRVANGLAISIDNGETFQKTSEAPIMDRNSLDPLGVSVQRVIREGDVWKTWYLSFLRWEKLGGTTEPFYTIKFAVSSDGVHWKRNGGICIGLNSEDEAVTSPMVLKEDGIYKMWYSFRTGRKYRVDRRDSYRIGYAESADGIVWTRMDQAAGIARSNSGWDSRMIAYPYVHQHKSNKYMFYNGNNFGQSGFGYAIHYED